MNNKLLSEAIADAKAVKETAIANAKLALEEAFTPHLKSMLSAKLQEMDREDMEEDEKEEVNEAPEFQHSVANSPAGDTLRNLSPRKVGTSTVQEEETEDEIDLDELLKELEDDDDSPEEEFELEGEFKDEEEIEDGLEDEEIDLEDMSEDDLKSFIEDVIKDMVMNGEIEAGESADVDDMDMQVDEAQINNKLRHKSKKKIDEMGGGSMREPSASASAGLDAIIAGLKKLVSQAGPLATKAKEALETLGTAAGQAMRSENEDKIDDIKEMGGGSMREPSDSASAGLDVIVAGLKKLVSQAGPLATKAKEALEALGTAAGQAMRSENEDEMDQMDELRKELQEVNLLNAKLLYTNKIFKSKNLTESKKIKVLKAFDNAKDVREAKTIFEVLSEGLVTSAPQFSRIKGFASKATGSEPKSGPQPIIESNDVYDRMRKLAGLI